MVPTSLDTCCPRPPVCVCSCVWSPLFPIKLFSDLSAAEGTPPLQPFPVCPLGPGSRHWPPWWTQSEKQAGVTKSASHSHPQLRAGGYAAWAWQCGHSPSSISRPWRREAGAGSCLCSRARPHTGLPGDPADGQQGQSSPRSRASG